MSAGFRSVQWNRYKIAYDATLAVLVGAYLLAFLYLGPLAWPANAAVDPQIVRMRAFGSCAFLMLTAILSIGPLARLDRRFLPLLYNRRHFGVMACAVAVLHAVSVLDWYHSHGSLPPLVSMLASNPRYLSFAGFPFEILGVAALAILTAMAATSHDLLLAFLAPPVWKALHMLIYPAYAAVVMHVMLGVVQGEQSPILPGLMAACFSLVAGLHIAAGWRERRRDAAPAAADDWLDVGLPDSIPEGAARVVATPGGERIAVFRSADRFSALSNVCAHQNGPLGEGRIIDGCVTCPWHGFQYRVEDGCAPPPFSERVPNFRLRIAHGILQVDRRALPPGTYVDPLDMSAAR